MDAKKGRLILPVGGSQAAVPPYQRRKRRRRRIPLRKITLVPLRYEQHRSSRSTYNKNEVENLPYRFASLNYGFAAGSSKRYLDFSNDFDRTQLNELQLPFFCTPEELEEMQRGQTASIDGLIGFKIRYP